MEALEDRLVPTAGVITATLNNAGLLTVTTPGNDSIAIRETSQPGVIDLFTSGSITFTDSSGNTSTSANSVAVGAADSVLVNNIVINGAGNDLIDLAGNAASASTTLLSGSLTINDSGNFYVTDSFPSAGPPAGFSVGGALTVNETGAGFISVSLVEADRVGSLAVNGGSGGASVSLGNSAMKIAGQATFTFTGGGDNFALLASVSIGGGVTYHGGTGGDTLFLFGNGNIGGDVTVTGAGTNGAVPFARVNSLLGPDVTPAISTGLGLAALVVGDTLNGGKGNFSTTNTGNGTALALAESVTFNNFSVTASSGAFGEVGDSTLNNVAIAGGGVGTEGGAEFSASGDAIAGNVAVAAGTGALSVAIQGSVVGGNVVTSEDGQGTASISVTGGSNLKGNLAFNAAAAGLAAFNATLNGSTIQGAVILNATDALGASTVNVESTTIGSAAGFAANPLGSFLSIGQGSGALNVNIGDVGASTIYGNVGIGTYGLGALTLKLGGAAAGEGATIRGGLDLNSTNNLVNPSPALSPISATLTNVSIGTHFAADAAGALGNSTFALSSVSVGGYLSLLTGQGNDSFTLNNVAVGNSPTAGNQAGFAIVTGAGNDAVSLTNDNLFGPAWVGGSTSQFLPGLTTVPPAASGTLNLSTSGGLFHGFFNYTGKTGNDTVVLGTAGNATQFLAGTSFIGNGGTDTINKDNAVFGGLGFGNDGTFTVT